LNYFNFPNKYSVRPVVSLYRCIPFRSNWGCFPTRRCIWARSRAPCPPSTIAVPPTGLPCQFISYCFLAPSVPGSRSLAHADGFSGVLRPFETIDGWPALALGRALRQLLLCCPGPRAGVWWRLFTRTVAASLLRNRAKEGKSGGVLGVFCFWAFVEFHSHHLCYK
jgi:hypothetical protein